MLDELLEYKEYTDKTLLDDILKYNSNIEASQCRLQSRLKYINFSNGYTGLRRPMIIISKYFLSKYEDNISIATNALKAWLGDKYENFGNQEIKDIAGYVNNNLFNFYRMNAKITKKNNNTKDIQLQEKNIENLENKHKDKLKSFNEDIINNNSKASNFGLDDFNKITIDSIVNSLKGKKINRRYLVCKKDILKDVYKNDKAIPTNEKDFLLKSIAVFLMNNTKNTEVCKIVWADLDNWRLCKHKIRNYYSYKYINGSTPIEKIYSNNSTYIKLDCILKENYRIVDYDDVDDIQIGEIVYIDKGSSKVLEELRIDSKLDLVKLKDIL